MQTRPWRTPLGAALIVLGAVGAVLCQVPLFNLLGYESSLALALSASLVAALLGVSVVRAAPAPVPRLFLSSAACALLALLAPLALLLANGLRVRNCDYLSGLSFFLMMPVGSALCGAALGVTCALWLRRGARGAALLIIIGVSLGVSLWRAASSPAVFAYDPFFGFFPGSLYDEEITLSAPFYCARLYHAAWIVAALAFTAARFDAHAPRARRRALGLGSAALLLALILHQQRGALGFDRDAAQVRAVLSGERVTRHFVLRFTPGGAVARDVDLIAREHEFRYAQLRDTLGVTPSWRAPRWQQVLLRLEQRPGEDGPRITSYLFESPRQKAELMGAAHTYIAKPWRREIYLQHEGWPHPVLKHELAHVFAGAAGDALLHLSLRGPLPELGLIEGVAVAADWPGGALSIHQQAHALREAHLAPAPAQLFGLAFWSQPATRAYVVAGSLCRYLLDTQGAAKLLAVYGQGGRAPAFAAVYGASLETLAAAWARFVDEQPVPPVEREVERERARRPAVFYKVCAHELALRRQRAHEAQGRGDAAEARRLLLLVCHDDPGEPRNLLDLSDTLYSLGLYAEATGAAEQVLRHAAVSGVLRGRALERLGDAAYLRGDGSAARAAWRAAAQLPGDEGALRLLAAKLAVSDDRLEGARARAGGRLLRALVSDPAANRDSALDLLAIYQATDEAPESALPWYLLGRQYLNRSAFADAAAALERALREQAAAPPGLEDPLRLPDGRFVVQARLWQAQALLRAGETARAALLFSALAAEQPPYAAGRRIEFLDWADRARRWPEAVVK